MTRWAQRILLVGLIVSLNGLPIVAALRHDHCARQQHACASQAVVTDDCCCNTIKNIPTQTAPPESSFLFASTPAVPVACAATAVTEDGRPYALAPGVVTILPGSTRNLPLRI
jgi:hypothetical protein